MYRILLTALIAILVSCNQVNSFKKYENTMWSGPYGPWEMSIIIDKVDGDTFSGEMHKPAGRIAYFEGKIFPNDSLVMTELYNVLGSGLVMNGTYPGKIEGDTLKGLCNFDNVPLPDESLYKYHLVRNKNFQSKTTDQKNISNVFIKTLPFTKKMSAIMVGVQDPFTELSDESKKRYAELVRKKRDLYEKAVAKIKDEKMKTLTKDPFIQETRMIWKLTENPVDSLWLINTINQYHEGEDQYYRMQQMKLSISKTPRKEFTDFLKEMYHASLTFNDQLSLLVDLMYESEKNDELKSMFDKRYAQLKKENPDNDQLKRLSELLSIIEVANKIKPGTIAPLFELESISGKIIKLSDLKGKFVFLDFWGSWCGPCRGEILNFREMANTIPSDQLQMIGLASDDEKALRKYLEEEPLPYPNALAPDEVLKNWGITGFPTTFLIDPQGRILAKNLRGENVIDLVKQEMEKYRQEKGEV